MEHFFIELFVLDVLADFKGYLLVGEEHEVVNQNLGGLLECVLGEDGAVGGDFESELVVVGLLVYTEVLNGVLYVLDGSVDGVDRYLVDGVVGGAIFIGRHPRTAFVDSELDCEACAGIQVANHKVGIDDFEAGEHLANVTCLELFLTRNGDCGLFGFRLFDDALEVDLLEVEDDVGDILLYAGDGIEFVAHAIDLDG